MSSGCGNGDGEDQRDRQWDLERARQAKEYREYKASHWIEPKKEELEEIPVLQPITRKVNKLDEGNSGGNS
jgi:hypothetical protein